MMLTLLWYLLTAPDNRLICQLWTEQINRAAIVQSCGEWVADHQEDYIARVEFPGIICNAPLNEIQLCNPAGQRVKVVTAKPESRFLCMVKVNHTGMPIPEEIAAACPPEVIRDFNAFKTRWSFQGPYEPYQPEELPPICPLASIPVGDGFYEQPIDYTDLSTDVRYELLEYQLRWHGLWEYSSWQNQFDEAILRASLANNIPARALKAIIAQESQFWPPSVGPVDEWGLIQISDDGADVALHYSPSLFEKYCPVALWQNTCSINTYRTLTAQGEQAVRWTLRANVRLDQYPPLEGAARALADIPLYAQILAAYRCHTLALVPGASWDMTLADYNAGGECIKTGQICPEGLEYIRKVKQ